MASGTFYPAVSADDGIRQGATSFQTTWVDGHIGRSAGDVPSKIFIRFPNVTIPNGSTITAAFVRFTSRSTTADATCSEELSFNDVDNAVAPTTYGEFDALVKTSATVAWTVGAWTNDAQHDSDDIATPLQEIIDRAGWSSGNAVMLIGDGTASDIGADRIFDQYDEAGGANKAELHITWTITHTGEISEDVSISSEFDDNFGELNEDASVNSEFACLVADSPISENVSVNSELSYFESDVLMSEDASVNSELIAEYTGELSEDASVNSGIEVIKKSIVEISEDASVNSEFVCYQRPANLDAELPIIIADILGGQGGFLDATLPLITADIKSGAILEASLPVITASLEGKVGAVGNIDATLPKLTADIKGKVETLGNVNAELPAVRAYIVGITGNLATCEATLPMVLADIQGVNDLSGDINAILPMIEPYIVGTAERAVCLVLRYDDLPDCIGNITASIPMIEASITEA